MMDMIVRTETEIESQLQSAEDTQASGVSNYAGMTYEDGMLDMYNWITGQTDEAPLED